MFFLIPFLSTNLSTIQIVSRATTNQGWP